MSLIVKKEISQGCVRRDENEAAAPPRPPDRNAEQRLIPPTRNVISLGTVPLRQSTYESAPTVVP